MSQNPEQDPKVDPKAEPTAEAKAAPTAEPKAEPRVSAPGAASNGRWFKLPVFEGPLDLLLHLIKKNELAAEDVAASIITEQYLEYLELLDSLNLELAGEYLVMATTLLLIKSFSLLPHQGPADEDEAEELKRDLIERLLEYQRYREVGYKLGERALLGRDVFAAPGEKPPPESGPPTIDVSVFDLVEALRVVLRRVAQNNPRALVLRDIPVAQCLPRILALVDAHGELDFLSLFDDLEDRPLVVAFFLGLLELLRRGTLRVWQATAFGSIRLARKEAPAPDSASGAI